MLLPKNWERVIVFEETDDAFGPSVKYYYIIRRKYDD